MTELRLVAKHQKENFFLVVYQYKESSYLLQQLIEIESNVSEE